jgi:hypothetical protein
MAEIAAILKKTAVAAQLQLNNNVWSLDYHFEKILPVQINFLTTSASYLVLLNPYQLSIHSNFLLPLVLTYIDFTLINMPGLHPDMKFHPLPLCF